MQKATSHLLAVSVSLWRLLYSVTFGMAFCMAASEYAAGKRGHLHVFGYIAPMIVDI